jgi:hypothetical protein
MNWSMQTRPVTVRRRPPSHTGPTSVAERGTPSAKPSGTSASPVSRSVVWTCPYDTPLPGGTRFTSATRLRSVIAGSSPYDTGGTGLSP